MCVCVVIYIYDSRLGSQALVGVPYYIEGRPLSLRAMPRPGFKPKQSHKARHGEKLGERRVQKCMSLCPSKLSPAVANRNPSVWFHI